MTHRKRAAPDAWPNDGWAGYRVSSGGRTDELLLRVDDFTKNTLITLNLEFNAARLPPTKLLAQLETCFIRFYSRPETAHAPVTWVDQSGRPTHLHRPFQPSHHLHKHTSPYLPPSGPGDANPAPGSHPRFLARTFAQATRAQHPHFPVGHPARATQGLLPPPKKTKPGPVASTGQGETRQSSSPPPPSREASQTVEGDQITEELQLHLSPEDMLLDHGAATEDPSEPPPPGTASPPPRRGNRAAAANEGQNQQENADMVEVEVRVDGGDNAAPRRSGSQARGGGRSRSNSANRQRPNDRRGLQGQLHPPRRETIPTAKIDQAIVEAMASLAPYGIVSLQTLLHRLQDLVNGHRRRPQDRLGDDERL